MSASSNNSVLLSGAGIAGPCLAYWLLQFGFRPTLIEAAPQPRQGGYLVDFWGVGYDVADRMGLIPELKRAGYFMEEVRLVDSLGEKTGGFDARQIWAVSGDRFFSIPRTDLARHLARTIEGRADTIYGDSVRAIAQDGAGVRVSFRHAEERSYDLVIGADGLHSAVRQLAFGEETQFERYLGYYVAAFSATNYPYRDENVYIGHTIVGRQIARYALRDGSTTFFFIWIEDKKLPIDHHDLAAQKKVLRDRFAGSGWESAAILAALDNCNDLYFDSVSQIRMDHWARGRVALVGDAAFCPSLLAGEGSSFAMAGAYILAGELHRAKGDHAAAFANYERLFSSFIRRKQDGATRFGGWFAPRTTFELWARNQITRLMGLPLIGNWMIGQMMRDDFDLPDYGGAR